MVSTLSLMDDNLQRSVSPEQLLQLHLKLTLLSLMVYIVQKYQSAMAHTGAQISGMLSCDVHLLMTWSLVLAKSTGCPVLVYVHYMPQ